MRLMGSRSPLQFGALSSCGPIKSCAQLKAKTAKSRLSTLPRHGTRGDWLAGAEMGHKKRQNWAYAWESKDHETKLNIYCAMHSHQSPFISSSNSVLLILDRT